MMRIIILSVLLAAFVQGSSAECTCKPIENFVNSVSITPDDLRISLGSLLKPVLSNPLVPDAFKNWDLDATISNIKVKDGKANFDLNVDGNLEISGVISVKGSLNFAVKVTLTEGCNLAGDATISQGTGDLTVTLANTVPLTIGVNQATLTAALQKDIQESVVMKHLINQGQRERRLFFRPKNGKLKD